MCSPGSSKIDFVDTKTGAVSERRLAYREEAEQSYGKLSEQGLKVRVGMEASGHSRRFERLLRELQLELWVGNAAGICTQRMRKQQADRGLHREAMFTIVDYREWIRKP